MSSPLPLSLARAVVGFPGQPRAAVLEPVRQPLRAWPWLCDRLGHVNNARYVDLLGYGRLRWLLETGVFRPLLDQRISFLVAGVGGVYRRQIPRMAAFYLDTRLASFDERWLYFEQVFTLDDASPAARFLTRMQVRRRRRGVSPHEALSLCGHTLPALPPAAPPDLDAWCAAQEACLAELQLPGRDSP